MTIKERLIQKKLDTFCKNVKKDELYTFIIYLLFNYNKKDENFDLVNCFNEITEFYNYTLKKGV